MTNNLSLVTRHSSLKYMCPCCHNGESVNDLDNFFDERYQLRAADRYLKYGLDSKSSALVAPVLPHLDGSQTILEVGCGAGMVHQDLLRQNKVGRAIGVDVSSAGIKVANRNASTFGLSDRIEYHAVDFAQNAELFASAELVVMDRVICCYPHLDLLLGQAAERASNYLAISFPVENFVSKFAIQAFTLALKLIGQTYHPYLHGHQKIQHTVEKAGLRLIHQDRRSIWTMMVFER